MKKTIGYVRVSTTEQSLSVAAQKTRLRAHAIAVGRSLDNIIVDHGHSAKTLERPGMRQILDDVAAGKIAAVVVVKLDRLTRSVRDLADLVETFQAQNVALISVSESLDTGSASGRMVMNMITTVAQWERETIAERTSAVLQYKRKNNKVYGKVPMGWKRVGNKLVKNAAEMRVLREMRRRYASGESACSIARGLNRAGVAPRQGGRAWYSASVLRVLSSSAAQALG